MERLAVFLFMFVIQFYQIEGARYDIDDPAGIISIVLLILAIIICIISVIMFFYIVYKLWHGNFGRRSYTPSHISRAKIARHEEEVDGRHPFQDTTPIYSYRNEVAMAEEARETKGTEVVETTSVVEDMRIEEVIVNQAPSTQQAEMETQELVVVFDDDDDEVEVLTHVSE